MTGPKRLWLLALLAALAPALEAAGKGGATGAAFLKIAPGARAAALGEAYTALADEPSALLWNPAGLGRMERAEVTATRTQWLQEADHDFMAGAIPTEYGTFGLSIVSLTVPDIQKRAADTVVADGTFDARDTAYTFGYGKELNESWLVGGSLHYIRQTLDGHSAAAPAVTLGGLWRTPVDSLTVGMALRNLGGEIKFNEEGDPLPMTAAAGLAWRTWKERLTVLAEARYLKDGDVTGAGGLEFSEPLFKDGRGFLRAGFNSGAADAEDATGISVGGGLSFGRWGVDLAWAPYGALGDTLRYGFRVSF